MNEWIYTGWSKKNLWCDLEESVWEILKYFFMESFSLYKLWGSKNPGNSLFQKSHPIKKNIVFFLLEKMWIYREKVSMKKNI